MQELIDKARKQLSGDNYTDEARSALEQAIAAGDDAAVRSLLVPTTARRVKPSEKKKSIGYTNGEIERLGNYARGLRILVDLIEKAEINDDDAKCVEMALAYGRERLLRR